VSIIQAEPLAPAFGGELGAQPAAEITVLQAVSGTPLVVPH
jgi:hypothetical protein